MNKKQNKRAIIWLSKIGISIYVEGLPNILSMPFGDSIRYFDVVDEIKLTKQIEDFLLINKIPSLNVHFIIGQDALMEKEFVLGNEEAVNKYLELIPYELVYSKKIFKQKSVLVTAFNGDFYRIISSILEKRNSHVLTLLPYSIIGQNVLNAQTVSLILKKADSFKNESMIDVKSQDIMDMPVLENSQKEEKSTLPILIPVFVILIVILVVVIYLTSQSNKKVNNSVNVAPTIAPIVIPTPTNLPLNITPGISEIPEKTATSSAL